VATHEQPLLDTEMLAEPLHVIDQVLRGVDRHVGGRIRGVGRGETAAALVEAEPPIAIWIETAPPGFPGAGTRSAVHGEGGFARGAAELQPVDRVTVTDVDGNCTFTRARTTSSGMAISSECIAMRLRPPCRAGCRNWSIR
jgi:hypothetical protein